jgi:putative oxidoreductase
MLLSDKQKDLGLLILRLGLGGMFMTHGLPKMLGGPAKWAGLGGAMGHVGVHFAPTFFGFMAAFSELGGGLCLALGLFFRPACGLLFITMAVASRMHLATGDGFGRASHAIELGIVFGGGEYRVRIGR